MKNLVLGIIGVFVILYTLLMGMNIMIVETNKNEMERQVSRIVKNILEAEYLSLEETKVKEILVKEIEHSLSKRGDLSVEIKAVDMQRGLLSVKVTKILQLLQGKEREIVVEKTAIMERAYVPLEREGS